MAGEGQPQEKPAALQGLPVRDTQGSSGVTPGLVHLQRQRLKEERWLLIVTQ